GGSPSAGRLLVTIVEAREAEGRLVPVQRIDTGEGRADGHGPVDRRPPETLERPPQRRLDAALRHGVLELLVSDVEIGGFEQVFERLPRRQERGVGEVSGFARAEVVTPHGAFQDDERTGMTAVSYLREGVERIDQVIVDPETQNDVEGPPQPGQLV